MARKSHPSERDFQTWIKRNWTGWVTQLHPGVGSDTGIPDLLLGTVHGLIPAELKLGSIDEDGLLWCSAVRPSQIRWHSALADAGFDSVLMVGVWEAERWRVFVVDAAIAGEASSGFVVGRQAVELDAGDLVEGLETVLLRGWW